MLCNASRASSSFSCGEGAGGLSIVTCVVAELFRPRESVQVALTVIGPGAAPAVFKLPVLPLPLMVPPVAFQAETFTSALSGLVHSQLMLTVPPGCKELGFAEQLMVGGFLGGSLTVKFAEQVAWLFFFAFGSVTWAVAV